MGEFLGNVGVEKHLIDYDLKSRSNRKKKDWEFNYQKQWPFKWWKYYKQKQKINNKQGKVFATYIINNKFTESTSKSWEEKSDFFPVNES